jgi:diketogulonate reductase-like aldo/keto reductase
MEKLTLNSTIMLNNGVRMPHFGFGCAELASTRKEQVEIIRNAIDVGYRLLDTAFIYHTERGVGDAVKASGIDRDEIFISTKIGNGEARRGRVAVIRSFEEMLRRLHTHYVDLLLLHWAVPGKMVETWKVMEDIYYSGRARALGLSNVDRYHHLVLIQNCDIMPHVQQDSFNPVSRNLYNKIFCDSHNIAFEAFSPVGRGSVLKIPELQDIGNKYGKNPIQIVLRWDLQSGVVPIPRTSTREHMESNADIFDFELTEDEMQKINALNQESDANWDSYNFNF